MAVLSGGLTLSRAVLSLASDPTTYVVAGTAGAIGGGGGKTDTFAIDGTIRNYANGHSRLIVGTATVRQHVLALRALTPSQVATIRAMAGKVVVYRDIYGRRIFGAFLSTSITEIPFSGDVSDDTLLTDVGLTITQVTYDEEV